jgi:hypothetical protein
MVAVTVMIDKAMESAPQSSTEAVLRHIIGIAQGLQQRCSTCSESSPVVDTEPSSLPPPSFSLSHVRSIADQLKTCGASDSQAVQVSQVYERYAGELRQRTEERLIRMWDELCRIPSSSRTQTVEALFLKTADAQARLYDHQLDQWASQAVARIQNCHQSSHSNQPRKTRGVTFNHVRPPLLLNNSRFH